MGYGSLADSGGSHALLWTGSAESVVDLHPAGFQVSSANAASGGKQGGYGNVGGVDHAVIWSGHAETVVDLHPSAYEYSFIMDMSGDRQVGWGKYSTERHALMWSGSAGSVTDLHPQGYTDSLALGVSGTEVVGHAQSNDDGELHALLWEGEGTPVDLHPEWAELSSATGVGYGVQVGWARVAGAPLLPGNCSVDHAVRWDGTAESAIDLHDFLPGEWDTSRADGVDEYGNIIGRARPMLGDSLQSDRAVLWWGNGFLEVPKLLIGSDGPMGSSIILDFNKSLGCTGVLEVAGDGSLLLDGTGVTIGGAMYIQTGGLLAGHGTIEGDVHGGGLSQIQAEGGTLLLGDDNSYSGFGTGGMFDVGSATVVLGCKGFANLGVLTEVDGGELMAANGVALGSGDNLVGTGTVAAKVAAAFGSTIEATGALALGDAGAFDGFFSDGTLRTGGNMVTIHDRNEAVLGSLTELGDGADGGTLTAGNADPADTYAHLLLEQGKNVIGRGSINGHFKNHGHAIGDGTGAAERLVFSSPWTVTGKGTFTNTLILGTFAPGESPSITSGENQGFGGRVEIELGGTTPGFGDDNHDQINDAGTILLAGSPTLAILPWADFVPDLGDEFVILTWQGGLDGVFGDVAVDPWFTDRDITFALRYGDTTGPGALTIEAVPEPATLALLALGGLAVLGRRRKPNAGR